MKTTLNQQPKYRNISIIGTDTDIGKTYVTQNIAANLIMRGMTIATIKPIACGTNAINTIDQCRNQVFFENTINEVGEGRNVHLAHETIPICINNSTNDSNHNNVNADALCLLQVNNVIKTIADINPICFNEAIAPHIAAQVNHYDLNVDTVIAITTKIMQRYTYDYMLLEGCGGLLTPLNLNQTYLNLLLKWNHPVILVVGIKLGCLNHALLTYQCLIQHNIPVLGWVANFIDPHMQQGMPIAEANFSYLTHKITAPLLGITPYNEKLHPSEYFYTVFNKTVAN